MTMLEERVARLSQAIEELILLVRGISGELTWVLGTVNAEMLRDRERAGVEATTLVEMDRQLSLLDEAIRKLGESSK